jgi:hypothetical protein
MKDTVASTLKTDSNNGAIALLRVEFLHSLYMVTPFFLMCKYTTSNKKFGVTISFFN